LGLFTVFFQGIIGTNLAAGTKHGHTAVPQKVSKNYNEEAPVSIHSPAAKSLHLFLNRVSVQILVGSLVYSFSHHSLAWQ
jgi:hypothetical protein